MNDSRDDYDYGPGFFDTCSASEFLSGILAAALIGLVVGGICVAVFAFVSWAIS